jgi:hypothetical protein
LRKKEAPLLSITGLTPPHFFGRLRDLRGRLGTTSCFNWLSKGGANSPRAAKARRIKIAAETLGFNAAAKIIC